MNDKPISRLIRPPNKIKQKIGPAANIRELLMPENIAKSQKVIDDQADQFLSWALKDIQRLNETLKHLRNHPMTKAELEVIVVCAEHLRDRGGTFNYSLVSSIAKSLYNYAVTIKAPAEEHLIVIEKHIEGLIVVVHERITSDGGNLGRELLSSLNQLVARYTK